MSLFSKHYRFNISDLCVETFEKENTSRRLSPGFHLSSKSEDFQTFRREKSRYIVSRFSIKYFLGKYIRRPTLRASVKSDIVLLRKLVLRRLYLV